MQPIQFPSLHATVFTQLPQANGSFSLHGLAPLGLTGHIQQGHLSPLQPTQTTSFKGVMANLVEGFNNTMEVPDKMMEEAMTTGKVDIHDVMIAHGKSDLAVSIATQVATKVIQAYDRVLQIQI